MAILCRWNWDRTRCVHRPRLVVTHHPICRSRCYDLERLALSLVYASRGSTGITKLGDWARFRPVPNHRFEVAQRLP